MPFKVCQNAPKDANMGGFSESKVKAGFFALLLPAHRAPPAPGCQTPRAPPCMMDFHARFR